MDDIALSMQIEVEDISDGNTGVHVALEGDGIEKPKVLYIPFALDLGNLVNILVRDNMKNRAKKV